MPDIPQLTSLGPRIIIMGPSNAGKSTLAAALAAKLDRPAFHLDQFRHQPHTDWLERPQVDFEALHSAAIEKPSWIIDGNYSALLPQRLLRATGIIVVDDHLWLRYWRYFSRTLRNGRRAGGLDGVRDTVKWKMVHWLWHTRRAAQRSRDRAVASGLPHVFVHDRRELKALYAAWQLTSPSA